MFSRYFYCQDLSHLMSHTRFVSVSVCVCICVRERAFVDMGSPACLSVCVGLCVFFISHSSTWNHLLYCCCPWTPPQHTHTRTNIVSVITEVQYVCWIVATCMTGDMNRTEQRHMNDSEWPLYTESAIFCTSENIGSYTCVCLDQTFGHISYPPWLLPWNLIAGILPPSRLLFLLHLPLVSSGG